MAIVKMQMVKLTSSKEHFEEILEPLINLNYFQAELASNVISAKEQGELVQPNRKILQARQFFTTVSSVFELDEQPWDGKEYSEEEIENLMQTVSEEYKTITDQINEFGELTKDDKIALEVLREYDITALNNLDYCHLYFGKIPNKMGKKLETSDVDSMIYDILHTCKEYQYLLCVTGDRYEVRAENLMSELSFENIAIPEIDDRTIVDAYHDLLQSVYGFVKQRAEIMDLYEYLVLQDNSYTLVGYVEKSHLAEFKDKYQAHHEVVIEEIDDFLSTGLTLPTKLKNNWFVKPFENFIYMYGVPNYIDFDPSALLAFTYSILFGMMFGDIGQGLVMSLIGFLWYKKSGNNIGAIIARIGIFSAFFGFIYGSIFGIEGLLDSFWANLGINFLPIHVMNPDNTIFLLLAACAIGGFLIIVSICTNAYLNLKRKNYLNFWFSSNGVAGLLFYGGILFLVVTSVALGMSTVNIFSILLIIVLPLLMMVFGRPFYNFIKQRPLLEDNSEVVIESKEEEFKHRYSDLKKEDLIALDKLNNYDFNALGQLGYTERFLVRLPFDFAKQLEKMNLDYLVYEVLNKNEDYYWILVMSNQEKKKEAKNLMRSLYMEPIDFPALEDGASAEEFSRQLAALVNKTEVVPAVKKNKMMAHSWSEYLIENFFELFEIILSFLTNTLSFLRVAGFVLSHAGMMLVVMTLREMAGNLDIIVLIFGNLFVMGLEGLIVGIQTLRLEYYEMFSRYFVSGGKTFKAISERE
ncbi:MAG: V-type ATP synthase subunit I [Erysipelotrichaceae bacterium]